jgi:hypothetical protein
MVHFVLLSDGSVVCIQKWEYTKCSLTETITIHVCLLRLDLPFRVPYSRTTPEAGRVTASLETTTTQREDY